MATVLITPSTLAGVGGPYEQALRGAGFDLAFPGLPGQLTEDELLHFLPGACATIAGSEPYTRRVLAANPALRVIARAGVGYDAVDLEAATERGVAVAIAPGTNQDSVAEHTFALILGLAKRLAEQHNAVKAGGWPRQANLPLRGRTLGILGLGRIGKAVALRGEAFGMRLLAYEPFPDREFASRHGVTLAPLDRVFAESDYLTVHVPLTPESRHFINRDTLARMKPTAFLINTARGPLVNEADLAAALRAKRLAGAALDVFETEPVAADNPLLRLDNVLLTPHAAGVDLQSRDDMALSAAQAIIKLSRGEWPAEQIVNPAVRSKFRW
ncbi:MAG TPA: phosphoglycerate dehydrogenase [Gemmataceae bacterium]|nr:phosphoglycerate dehydrogenase [Gemmataceae bacterium]